MQIFINVLIGHKIAIEAGSLESIRQIKEKIQALRGIPPDQQKLIFAGKQLVEERPSYYIETKEINLVQYYSIILHDGTIFNDQLFLDRTEAETAAKIIKNRTVTVSDYNIQHEAVIELVLLMRGDIGNFIDCKTNEQKNYFPCTSMLEFEQ